MTRRARRQRMMKAQEHVELRIDRLTLRDVSSHVGQRIADSLSATLEQELAALRTLPDRSASHANHSATVQVYPAEMPEDVGASLARAIMEFLKE